MNTAIKNILVPTDLSEKSLNAIEMAVQMAIRHHARIILFHMIPNYFMIDRTGKQVIGYKTIEENTIKVQAGLDALKTALTERYEGLKIETKIRHQDLVDSMNDFVVSENIDLVVVGTSGRQKLKQLILGSSSYHMLSYVHCSVLLVPETCTHYSFKKILFPVRVLDNLNAKLELSLIIAKKNQGVISLLGISDEYGPESLTNAFLDLKKQLHMRSADYTSEFLLTRNKAIEISEFSKKKAADLIILNYEDEESWKSIFSENFLKKIINATDVPLLFLKPKITIKIPQGNPNAYDITLPCPG
ncbi:hypothetical protein DRF60_06240 [Chryseobacterium elymi]|uniref:UspA domain-containing protein n=1 Tax=Chryseobacterium elymi TaxID=395936 RepID=A0A3D9DN48_9FLAO|nr:universal stress protein [Chryseobacterium elymi]REC79422.1 hypothetical protein DRF60_06240 [Chryseobacterium elymi]